jgi:hypothetical protein
MGQTSVSFESMSSITQEKTHQKRPYGSLRIPPIPALPGFPKNPQLRKTIKKYVFFNVCSLILKINLIMYVSLKYI